MTILERLKELQAKATPGEWNNSIAEYSDGAYQAVGPEHHPEYEEGTWEELSDRAEADQELIDTLRNTLPAILEVLEALKSMACVAYLDLSPGASGKIVYLPHEAFNKAQKALAKLEADDET